MAPLESDSDVEIIETESNENYNYHHRRPEPFKFSARMYPAVPGGLLSPPFSPNDPMDMPLLKEVLARNGQVNVPEGFVLCIPCYLCKRPFNDYETLKEHLTQHAAEISAWNTTRAQAQEPPAMIKPFVHPINQPFVHPMEQPIFHPHHDQAVGHHERQYHMPVEFGHQPPLDLYSPPLEPPMGFPMPSPHQHPHSIQPPMHFPPLEFPGPRPQKLFMPPQITQETPVQPVLRNILKNPRFPLEIQNLIVPEKVSFAVEEPPASVKPKSLSPVPSPVPTKKTPSPVLIKPKIPKQSTYVRGQFECDWCGKRLSSRQSLRYHESHFHAEEEPPANGMGKDGQKQHKCATCKKRYKRRTFLQMHMKVKHGIVCTGKFVPYPLSPTAADAPAPRETEEASPTSPPAEESRKEIWSTRIYNAVAAAKYQPASERAEKYLNAPRQQTDLMESGFATTPKRTYPLRSPFFNPYVQITLITYQPL
ncbi:hypothetical protein KR084_011559 [Drosophila pseudotakahashii]|nr:hypothetical protein KR084_011559 [Drosophila pseudotakahashii]